jgi:hypothetical protein
MDATVNKPSADEKKAMELKTANFNPLMRVV